MRWLAIALLTGCAGNDFMYGPMERMIDVGFVSACTEGGSALCGASDHPDYYDHYVEPEITVVVAEDLYNYCDPQAVRWGIQACVHINYNWTEATVYIHPRANPGILPHEEKHAHGYCHYMPRFDLFWHMPEAEKEREIALAKKWYKCPDLPIGYSL